MGGGKDNFEIAVGYCLRQLAAVVEEVLKSK